MKFINYNNFLLLMADEPRHIYEMYEGFIIVDFVPTSEEISAWLLKVVENKMKTFNVKVSHI